MHLLILVYYVFPQLVKTCANSFFDRSFVYVTPTLGNAFDLDIRLLLFDAFNKRVKTHLYFVNDFLLYLYYVYDIYVSIMRIYCDYCVYYYKSTELVSLYSLDIGL